MATVETREDFEAWLSDQPREVCVAIAHRAALRVLPLATVVGAVTNGRALSLAAFRASLTSRVSAVRQSPDIRDAARKAAAAAEAEARVAADDGADAPAFAAYAAGAAADAAARSTADAAGNAAAFAAYAANAAALAAADIAADAAAFADTKIPQCDLMARAIRLPQDLQSAIVPVQTDPQNALQTGAPWAFWADWYTHARAGDPLPWAVQEAIALLPHEIWHAGPEAVAVAIGEVAHGLP